jgi:hypothetical protein
LTAEGTTSKGTGSISCEVEFCIFYRLSLRTLRTKDVNQHKFRITTHSLYEFSESHDILMAGMSVGEVNRTGLFTAI